MTPIRRPVLRYFGGKFRLRSWILGFFPPHRIYVEPFGGAASVLLAKDPSFAEVYNDLDGELVNLFRVLRDPKKAKRLQAMLELTPFARAEFEQSYQPSKDPVESARRLVVRSFLGFGGDAHNSGVKTGFRQKSWRQNGTGPTDWVNLPQHIESFTSRLQGVVIEQRPASAVIAAQDRDDALIYADPPYVHGVRSKQAKGGNGKYAHELSDDDHRLLAQQLRGCRGMVILSGYGCPLYDDFYQGWDRHQKDTIGDGGRPRTECLWLNPACSAALKASRAQLEIVG